MSELSITAFRSLATDFRVDDTKAIRLAAHDSKALVSQGSLGNRLASLFRGDTLSSDQIRRQDLARTAFVEALTDRYGTALARAALSSAAIDGTAPLTGRAIKTALASVEGAIRTNSGGYEQAVLALTRPALRRRRATGASRYSSRGRT